MLHPSSPTSDPQADIVPSAAAWVLRMPVWAWAPLYTLAWVLGYHISSYYWFLPAGLRIASLLLAPRRIWPWLLLGEVLAIIWLFQGTISYQSWISAALGNGPPWLLAAATVAVGWRYGSRPHNPAIMFRLLALCLIAAMLVAPLVTLQLFLEGDIGGGEVPERLIGMLIGDFVSMIIAAPALLSVADMRGVADLRHVLRYQLAPIIPALALCALATWIWPALTAYMLVLALAPMMLTAFRNGWRGAALALLLTSFAIYAIGELGSVAIDRPLMQLIVAVFGPGVLMLGAAVDSIRSSNHQLAANVAALSDANQQLLQQSNELMDLSRRLVRVEEDEQKRIASELQDELGQSMSTMGVRLGLASRQSRDPGTLAVIDAMREMVRDLHTTIRGVVSRLTPTPPRVKGFVEALRDGTLGRLLGEAGIETSYDIHESLEQLTDSQRTVLFRMCQEAATDAIRNGHVTSLCLRIQVDQPSDSATTDDVVRLQISQRLNGPATTVRPQRERDNHAEHRGIRDRARSVGGSYRRSLNDDLAIADVILPARFKSL